MERTLIMEQGMILQRYVSWHMAADFSNHLTQQHNSLNGTNLEECYSCSSSGTTSVTCSTAVQPIYECTGYRLPTEASGSMRHVREQAQPFGRAMGEESPQWILRFDNHPHRWIRAYLWVVFSDPIILLMVPKRSRPSFPTRMVSTT